jgi:hypothetical protein
MIFIILAIVLAVAIGCFIGYYYTDSFPCLLGTALGAMASVAALTVAIGLAYNCVELRTIDTRIAMYEEENAKIEAQVDATIETYMEYEKNIMAETSPDTQSEENSVVLVAAYPELASNALVREQVKIYTENNKKIKELKDAKIMGVTKQWWLYFGGF